LSGPLIDRLDLHIEVPRVDFATLSGDSAVSASNDATGCSPSKADRWGSATVAPRVLAARERQLARQGCVNARLDAAGTQQHAVADAAGTKLLARAASSLGLSARACHRVLRVARTIADVDGCRQIATEHVAEAIAYRRLDRRRESTN